jgi:hypothetical protein
VSCIIVDLKVTKLRLTMESSTVSLSGIGIVVLIAYKLVSIPSFDL